jgi:hypothetical protein
MGGLVGGVDEGDDVSTAGDDSASCTDDLATTGVVVGGVTGLVGTAAARAAVASASGGGASNVDGLGTAAGERRPAMGGSGEGPRHPKRMRISVKSTRRRCSSAWRQPRITSSHVAGSGAPVLPRLRRLETEAGVELLHQCRPTEGGAPVSSAYATAPNA